MESNIFKLQLNLIRFEYLIVRVTVSFISSALVAYVLSMSSGRYVDCLMPENSNMSAIEQI